MYSYFCLVKKIDMAFSARMLSCDCNFPFQICVDSDREDGSVSPFLFIFSDRSLTFFVFIWFQGSEWNAANFEELQKNKLVVEPVTLSAALCVVVCLCIPLTHYKGNI